MEIKSLNEDESMQAGREALSSQIFQKHCRCLEKSPAAAMYRKINERGEVVCTICNKIACQIAVRIDES